LYLIHPIYRNESFTFNGVGPETHILHIAVFDHKTLGKDKFVGDADVEVGSFVEYQGSILT